LEQKYRQNDRIQAEVLFVVSEEEGRLGEMSRTAALELARSQGKDLVEIVPTAKPPVAKIIEWSKFKYDAKKKKKGQKSKSQEQKEIWFKAFIGDGDIDHKMKKVREFVEDGHRVKLTIRRKGRVNPDQFKELMVKLLAKIDEFASIMTEAKFEGGNYAAVIGPKK
jgi:translation initiation factor IF-3